MHFIACTQVGWNNQTHTQAWLINWLYQLEATPINMEGCFLFLPRYKNPCWCINEIGETLQWNRHVFLRFLYQKSMCSTVMVDFLASQFQLQGCWVKTSPPSANPETCEKSHGDQSAIFLFKRYQVVHRRKESSKDGSWSFKTCSLVKDYN